MSNSAESIAVGLSRVFSVVWKIVLVVVIAMVAYVAFLGLVFGLAWWGTVQGESTPGTPSQVTTSTTVRN